MAVERSTHLFVALHDEEEFNDFKNLIMEGEQIFNIGRGTDKRLTIECDHGRCYKMTFNQTVDFDEKK